LNELFTQKAVISKKDYEEKHAILKRKLASIEGDLTSDFD